MAGRRGKTTEVHPVSGPTACRQLRACAGQFAGMSRRSRPKERGTGEAGDAAGRMRQKPPARAQRRNPPAGEGPKPPRSRRRNQGEEEERTFGHHARRLRSRSPWSRVPWVAGHDVISGAARLPCDKRHSALHGANLVVDRHQRPERPASRCARRADMSSLAANRSMSPTMWSRPRPVRRELSLDQPAHHWHPPTGSSASPARSAAQDILGRIPVIPPPNACTFRQACSSGLTGFREIRPMKASRWH